MFYKKLCGGPGRRSLRGCLYKFFSYRLLTFSLLFLIAFSSVGFASKQVIVPEEQINLQTFGDPYEYFLHVYQYGYSPGWYYTYSLTDYKGLNKIKGHNDYELDTRIYYRVLIHPDGTEEFIDEYKFDNKNITRTEETNCKETVQESDSGQGGGYSETRKGCSKHRYYSEHVIPEETIEIKNPQVGMYKLEIRRIDIPAYMAEKYPDLTKDSIASVYDAERSSYYEITKENWRGGSYYQMSLLCTPTTPEEYEETESFSTYRYERTHRWGYPDISCSDLGMSRVDVLGCNDAYYRYTTSYYNEPGYYSNYHNFERACWIPNKLSEPINISEFATVDIEYEFELVKPPEIVKPFQDITVTEGEAAIVDVLDPNKVIDPDNDPITLFFETLNYTLFSDDTTDKEVHNNELKIDLSKWYEVGGKRYAEDGGLVIDGRASGIATMYTDGLNLENYELDFDAKVTYYENSWHYLNLYFYSQSKKNIENSYLIHLRKEQGSMTFFKVVDGAWIELYTRSLPFDIDSMHHYKIKTKNGKIIFYIDDEKMFEFEDDSYTLGTFGFGAQTGGNERVKILFKDIKLNGELVGYMQEGFKDFEVKAFGSESTSSLVSFDAYYATSVYMELYDSFDFSENHRFENDVAACDANPVEPEADIYLFKAACCGEVCAFSERPTQIIKASAQAIYATNDLEVDCSSVSYNPNIERIDLSKVVCVKTKEGKITKTVMLNEVIWGAESINFAYKLENMGLLLNLFTWQTERGDAGEYEIKVIVKDPYGGKDEDTFIITVLPAPVEPIIISSSAAVFNPNAGETSASASNGIGSGSPPASGNDSPINPFNATAGAAAVVTAMGIGTYISRKKNNITLSMAEVYANTNMTQSYKTPQEKRVEGLPYWDEVVVPANYTDDLNCKEVSNFDPLGFHPGALKQKRCEEGNSHFVTYPNGTNQSYMTGHRDYFNPAGMDGMAGHLITDVGANLVTKGFREDEVYGFKNENNPWYPDGTSTDEEFFRSERILKERQAFVDDANSQLAWLGNSVKGRLAEDQSEWCKHGFNKGYPVTCALKPRKNEWWALGAIAVDGLTFPIRMMGAMAKNVDTTFKSSFTLPSKIKDFTKSEAIKPTAVKRNKTNTIATNFSLSSLVKTSPQAINTTFNFTNNSVYGSTYNNTQTSTGYISSGGFVSSISNRINNITSNLSSNIRSGGNIASRALRVVGNSISSVFNTATRAVSNGIRSAGRSVSNFLGGVRNFFGF